MELPILLAALFFTVSSAFVAAEIYPNVPDKEEIPLDNKKTRLSGATDAVEGEFPWQVSIQKRSGNKLHHFCGGSILSERHILCAAHCTVDEDISRIIVVAGAHNMKNASEAGQQHARVKRLANNPNYNPISISYDSSIIVLAEPLKFNVRVKSIRLAPAGHEPKGRCVSSGWGDSDLLPILPIPIVTPNRLQKLSMTVVDRNLCRIPHLFNDLSWIGSTMLCANAGGLFRGACQGDSGGPLVCYDLPGGDPYIAGITSWGTNPCGRFFYPTVYGNVAAMRDFIDKELKRT